MNVALESPDQPEIVALIAQMDAYQGTLYLLPRVVAR
jgi:putative acetyltransferase